MNDREPQLSGLVSRSRTDALDLQFDESFGRELDRIAQEVDQNLPQPSRIGEHPIGHHRQVTRPQWQFFGIGSHFQRGQHIGHQVRWRDLQQFDIQSPSLDLRQIENVIDDAQKMFAVSQNRLCRPSPFEVFHRLQKVFREAQNGGQRRADFMSHVGEKPTLRIIRRVRCVFLLLDDLVGFGEQFRLRQQQPVNVEQRERAVVIDHQRFVDRTRWSRERELGPLRYLAVRRQHPGLFHQVLEQIPNGPFSNIIRRRMDG